jgi:hypothetical protein
MADQMLLRLALVGAAALGLSAPATFAAGDPATPVQDAAVRFGPIGVWAPDCSRPPAPANGYEHWALEPDGAVSETIDPGPGYQPNRYVWSQGRLVGDNQIQLDGAYAHDNVAEHDLMRKVDGRLQTYEAVDGTGRKLITDGRVPIYAAVAVPNPQPGQPAYRPVDTGQTREVVWANKCQGR